MVVTKQPITVRQKINTKFTRWLFKVSMLWRHTFYFWRPKKGHAVTSCRPHQRRLTNSNCIYFHYNGHFLILKDKLKMAISMPFTPYRRGLPANQHQFLEFSDRCWRDAIFSSALISALIKSLVYEVIKNQTSRGKSHSKSIRSTYIMWQEAMESSAFPDNL